MSGRSGRIARAAAKREACAIDLRHDPNGLIWEAYCPNSEVLNALVALTEASG
jgi:hypothetical protein